MQLKCEDLCSVWRRCCDSPNVLTVVCEVHAGDFSLDGVPWSGRPVEIDRDQMETLTENNQLLYHVGDSGHTQNI